MAKVSLDRMTDGRHVVMDAQGNAIGVHNSLRSAQRQIEDYYEPAVAASGSGSRQVTPALEQVAGQTAASAGTIENPAAAQAAMQQQLAGQQQMQDQAHHQLLRQAGVNPMAMAAQSALQAYQQPQGQAQPYQPAQGQMDQQRAAAANVNLVNQRANGPWQGGADPAQLQAAWNAFHPQGQPRGQ